MARKKRKKSASDAAPMDRRGRRLQKMERALDELASDLARLDPKAMEEVGKELRTYPTAALRILLKRLGSNDTATQTVTERALVSCGGAEVVDNLKATVFDVDAPDAVKVRANELLAELDAPVDSDVLEMSVPNAAEIASRLPGRAFEAVAAGDLEQAGTRFEALDASQRIGLVHRIAAELPDRAVGFYRAILDRGETIREAILWALTHHAQADAVDLVVELSESGSKTIQKAAKRALFALKAAGVDVPEPKRPEPQAEEAELPDDRLPIYRALAARNAKDEGEGIYLSLARLRPNGRLKALIMLVHPWAGMRIATFRSDISKSAYDRTLKATPEGMVSKESTVDEIRSVAARGIVACKLLGTRIPLDFQLGRSLLGDVDRAIAAVGDPFRCEGCGAGLGKEAVEQIRDSLVYRHVKVEKLCAECRAAKAKEAGKA